MFYLGSERLGHVDYHFTNSSNNLYFDLRGFQLTKQGLFTLQIDYDNGTSWTCSNETIMGEDHYKFMSCNQIMQPNTKFTVRLLTFFMSRMTTLNSFIYDGSGNVSYDPPIEFQLKPGWNCATSTKLDNFQSPPMTVQAEFCCW